MKKYNIKVNGVTYEVEVEEIIKEVEGFQAQAIEVPIPETSQIQNKIEGKMTATEAKIESPIAGTIIKVNVKPGDTVKKGQVLFILEAMKMENEITAPYDGNILRINVSNGASVNGGDVLATIL